MGLQPEETEDHWVRDETSATWTRVIVGPRKLPYHPEEDLGGPFQDQPKPSVASASGGALYFGDFAVRGWASTQAVHALSSGEA